MGLCISPSANFNLINFSTSANESLFVYPVKEMTVVVLLVDYQFCEMMHLSFPMMVVLLHVARDQQSDSHHCKSKHCQDATSCSHQPVRLFLIVQFDKHFLCCHFANCKQVGRSIVITQNENDDEPETILIVPQKQKCSQRKVTKLIVPQERKCSWKEVATFNNNQTGKSVFGVIHQLLMQAGDVETNPGPGHYVIIIS